MNPKNREDFAESSDEAIVSFKNDRGTKYETYIEVYNEIQAAYNELWDEYSNGKFGKDYEFLELADRKAVRAVIPKKLSEAEPSAFGEE